MSEEKKLFPPKLFQIGVVVRDLDASIKNYRELLGIEPTRIIEKSPAAPGKKYYNGEEKNFFQRVALYYFGDVEYELLQPYGDDSALSDFLKEHGEGVHHVAFDTTDFAAFEQHLKDHGIRQVQTGPNSRTPLLHWGFYSTNDTLGTMIELTNFAEVAAIEAKEKQAEEK